MKKRILQWSKKATLMNLLIFLVAQSTASAQESSIGIGAGYMYSGVGINYMSSSDHTRFYLAGGCPSLSRESGNSTISLACGVGAGVMRTGLFMDLNRQHAFGLYGGAIAGKHRRSGNTSDEYAVYGMAVTYNYFFTNGQLNGLNIGFSPLAVYIDDDTASWTALLNVGYQFNIKHK